MFQIDNATAAGTPPTIPAPGTEGHFTKGNPGSSIPATIVDDWWLEMMQGELGAILAAAGIAHDKTNNAQVIASIKALIQKKATNYAVDTGAANTCVLALTPAITAYAGGIRIAFEPNHDNTGATTLNAGGGAQPVVYPDGTALQALALKGGGHAVVDWSVALGKWVLITSLLTNVPNNMATSGYSKIPGTPFWMQWATFSVATLTGNTNTPTGTLWEQQAVSLPVGFSNQSFWFGIEMDITANGQFVFGQPQGRSAGGCTAYVTSSAAATLPLNGIILAIGW